MTGELKVVLTGTRSQAALPAEAFAFAREAGIEVVERLGRSIESIARAAEADAVLVWQPDGPVLNFASGGSFHFHPSMAKNRIQVLRRGGGSDPMVEAMGLKAGDSVLDCTLGLSADSIVASYVVGHGGTVVGLEKSRLLAAMVKRGLKHYQTDIEPLREAMQRIVVIHADHRDYLCSLPDRSFDVVFFDPMFERPVMKSAAIGAMRRLAEGQPLDKEAVREGIRVARRCVVVKERSGGRLFEMIGCDTVVGGKSSSVAFGVIRVADRDGRQTEGE